MVETLVIALGIVAWTLVIATVLAHLMGERVMNRMWVPGDGPAPRYLRSLAHRKADAWRKLAKWSAIAGAVCNIVAIAIAMGG
jgi:hypothetical protein